MNIILEDISQIFYNIKEFIKKKIDNKFCSYCNEWLHNKICVFDKENSLYFCDEDCKSNREKMFEIFKGYWKGYNEHKI